MKRFFLLLALLAAPARADDEQLWASAEASGSIGGRWDATFNIQARGGSEQRQRQAFYSAGLDYELGKRTTLSAAYTLVLSRDTERGARTEHRLQQELTADLIDRPGLRVESRTRVEQRFFTDGETRYRFRQQLRGELPVSDSLTLLASTEAFSILNNPDRDGIGIDRWRHFAGVEVPLSDEFSIEAGYIHQHNHRRGPDETNRIATVALSASW